MAILIKGPDISGINATKLESSSDDLTVKVRRISVQRISGVCMVDVDYLGDYYGFDTFSFKSIDESGNVIKQAYQSLLSLDAFIKGVKC